MSKRKLKKAAFGQSFSAIFGIVSSIGFALSRSPIRKGKSGNGAKRDCDFEESSPQECRQAVRSESGRVEAFSSVTVPLPGHQCQRRKRHVSRYVAYLLLGLLN